MFRCKATLETGAHRYTGKCIAYECAVATTRRRKTFLIFIAAIFHDQWSLTSFPPISLSQGEIVKLSLLYSLPLSLYPSNKSIIGERIFIKLHNPNEIAASMMWQRVFGLIFLKVSKECAASFFRILTKGTLSHIRRSQSSNSAPWYNKLLLTKHEIFWKLLKDFMFYKIGR